MDKGATRYTLMAGTVELRRAIAAKLERENGLRLCAERDHRHQRRQERDLQRVRDHAGARRRGDHPRALLGVVPGHGAGLRWHARYRAPADEAHGFKLTAAQLEAAITPRTRWLLINSPSNPTGASYTADEYRALADVLASHPHVMVMTDDIYEHIRFDGESTPHLLAVAPELRDRTLAVNGVSKTYAMTGWRIGWIAGPDATWSRRSTPCCRSRPATAARSARPPPRPR